MNKAQKLIEEYNLLNNTGREIQLDHEKNDLELIQCKLSKYLQETRLTPGETYVGQCLLNAMSNNCKESVLCWKEMADKSKTFSKEFKETIANLTKDIK